MLIIQAAFGAGIRTCNYHSIAFESCRCIAVTIPQALRSTHYGTQRISLLQMIKNSLQQQVITSLECSDCVNNNRGSGDCVTERWLTRLPPYLLNQIARFEDLPTKGNHTPRLREIFKGVRFPIKGLDLYECVHPDLRFKMARTFDCIAVTQHLGLGVSAAHYTTGAKFEEEDGTVGWCRFNDQDTAYMNPARLEVFAFLLLKGFNTHLSRFWGNDPYLILLRNINQSH